ncbi:DUF3027 domain-containing protein [Microbacterium sp. P02]|uniref:DUF3027 domain-containing protein n=1 Tax=Microbacterium sp. P02 TaxID=3366260 RepID=UPI00366A9840
MNSTPEAGSSDIDARLLESHDLARAALAEITPEATIGAPVGYTPEGDGVVSLRFETLLPGYPGWFWTVSVARVEDAEPTVLEVELLPGDAALLAPDWVPWAVRLADYQAAQQALADAGVVLEDDVIIVDDEDAELDEDLDDVEDLDAADFDNDGSPILHAGDLDGVDIDELDPAAPLDEESDEDESEDDDESDEDEDEDDESDEDDDESDEDEDDDELEDDDRR